MDLADVDLQPARIADAARTIDPVFLHSPQYVDEQLCAALGYDVMVKVETLNPIGSFKGRGADLLVQRLLREGARGRTLVCVTSGNFGQAVAYAGRAYGASVHVFVSSDVNPAKQARMESLGAAVTSVPGGGAEVERALDDHMAAHPDDLLISGAEPEVAEGAGTIAIELLDGADVDTVVVPFGSGSLIAGIARWVKEKAPAIRVIGICAEGSPAMAESWRAGRPIAADARTIAEGIATWTPQPELVARTRVLVDDVVLVSDADILAAAGVAARTLGLLLEPAGAAGLAAIARGLPGRRFATVLTGAGPRPAIAREIMALAG